MLAAWRPSAPLRSFLITATLAGTAILVACSSEPAPVTTTEGCDSSKCLPGNTCLPFEGETKCRRTCSSNTDPATSCPFGYTCTDPSTGDPPFCVENTALRDDGTPLTQKPNGQWGTPCLANLGSNNPECDIEQDFYCHAESPTDADAYCTRFGCTTDRDCGAGFWCATVNATPNANTANRKKVGEVMNVCLRRAYCATCSADLDCPPIQGRAQYCVLDASGTSVCMPECDNNRACPSEARCADVGLGIGKVCYPRATVCVGDGSLCSPCRADSDCGEDGACVKGAYTTEKTCAKKSTTSCGTRDKPTRGSCVARLDDAPNSEIYCAGTFFESIPEDYCHGVYRIGAESLDVGCWTPKR